MVAVTKHESEAWWVGDPNVRLCPKCRCPIQAAARTKHSPPTLHEGMQQHLRTVHPNGDRP